MYKLTYERTNIYKIMMTTKTTAENLDGKRISATLKNMKLDESQSFSLSKLDSVYTLVRRISIKNKMKFSTATDQALYIITVTRIL